MDAANTARPAAYADAEIAVREHVRCIGRGIGSHSHLTGSLTATYFAQIRVRLDVRHSEGELA